MQIKNVTKVYKRSIFKPKKYLHITNIKTEIDKDIPINLTILDLWSLNKSSIIK